MKTRIVVVSLLGSLLVLALAYSNHVGWIFAVNPVEKRGGEGFYHK